MKDVLNDDDFDGNDDHIDALKDEVNHLRALLADKTNVLIVLDGGLVQSVGVDGPIGRIAVIDYDIDGLDKGDLTPIPQGKRGEKPQLAYCRFEKPWRKKRELRSVHGALDRDFAKKEEQ
jgi:hypothetical protein